MNKYCILIICVFGVFQINAQTKNQKAYSYINKANKAIEESIDYSEALINFNKAMKLMGDITDKNVASLGARSYFEVHLLWTGGVHEGCWSTHSARVSCAIPRHCPAEQHPLPCGLCIPLIKLYSPARKQLVKYEVQACTHSDAVCKGHFVSTWKLRLHRKPAAWCEGSWCASRRTLWHHELFPTPSCAHVQFRFTCTVPRQDAVCYLAGNSSTKVLQGAGEVSSFTSFPPASTGT